jgi:hypothetical protein
VGERRLHLLPLVTAVLLACGPGDRPPGPPEGPEVPEEPGLAPPSGLAYPVISAVYAVGVPVAPNVPASGGGAVASYSVSPPLPAGLALDPSTGVLSGTPLALAPAALYVVTASNAAGSATCAIAVTVAEAGTVWIRPGSAGLTTRSSLQFSAGVAGADEAVAWSASSGEIDGEGRYTAPRLPGSATVTAARTGVPASEATARVTVYPWSTGNIEVAVTSPAGDTIAGGTLIVTATVSTRYLLMGVEADLDERSIAMSAAGDGTWSGALDVSRLPDGGCWLRVAAWDFTGATTEVFRLLTLAREP